MALTVSTGFKSMLLTYGAFAFIVLILFYLLGKEAEGGFEEEHKLREYLNVLKNRNILILSIIAFVGVGYSPHTLHGLNRFLKSMDWMWKQPG